MIEPIFEGTRAHCKKHSTQLIKPNEDKCDACKWLDSALNIKPPFKVVCTWSSYDTHKDDTYEVVWVIRDGAYEYNEKIMGYVFKDDKGNIVPRIYDATNFAPWAWVSDDQKKVIENRREEERKKKEDDYVGVIG